MSVTSNRPEAERRQHPRHHTDLKITMLSEHNFFMGLSENMSEGGLFVATHDMQPIGTMVDLKFKLPMHDEPLEVRGEVRWVRPYSQDVEAAPGMGVRFVGLTAEQGELIRAFLRSRPPIFYDD